MLMSLNHGATNINKIRWWPQRELVDRLVSSRLTSRGWPLMRNNHNQNRCNRAGRSHFQKWPTHLRLVDYEADPNLPPSFEPLLRSGLGWYRALDFQGSRLHLPGFW